MTTLQIKLRRFIIIIAIFSLGSGILGWLIGRKFPLIKQNQTKQELSSEGQPQTMKGDNPSRQSQNISSQTSPDQSGIAADIASKKTDNQSVQSDNPVAQGIIYKNDRYGFQVTLPKGWEKYKAKEKGGMVEISLPSNDFNGKYVPVVDILVWSTADWQKNIEQCQKEPSPNCFDDSSIAAESKDYVFVITTSSNSLPDDLSPMNPNSILKDYIETITKSFQIN